MATPAAQVEVRLDTKQADEDAKVFSRSLSESLVGIKAGLDLASAAFSAIGSVISAVVGTVADWTKAAMEAEAADRRLVVALQQRGQYTKEAVEELRAYNTAIQQSTGISGDELAAIQGTMVALGAKREQLQLATKAAIGLAQITGTDLTSAATTVGKAINGQLGALKKLGIEANDTGSALRHLASAYGLAEAQGQTLEGQLAILKENYGDLQESLGQAVTESHAARDGLKAINEAVVGLGQVLNSPDGRLAVDGFFRAIILGTGFAIEMTADLAEKIGSLWTRFKVWKDGFIAESFDPDAAPVKSTIEVMRELAAQLGAIGVGEAQTGAAPIPNVPKTPGGGGDPKAAAKLEEQINAAMKRAAKAQAEVYSNQLQAQRDQLEAQEILRDLAFNTELENERRREAIRQEQQKAAFDARVKESTRYIGTITDIAGTATTALGNAIVTALTSDTSFGDALKAAFGQAFIQMGGLLIQAGIVATVLGTIGAFTGLFGGPAGLIVGPPAIAAGVAMVSLGHAMAGGGGGPSGAAGNARANAGQAATVGASAGRGDSAIPQTAAPAGFKSDSNGSKTTVINVSFGRGVVMGTPRQVARELRDVLREGATLAPGGA